MKKTFSVSILVLTFILTGLTACSGGDLTVEEAWGRPGIAGGNSGVFFILDNQTGVDDRLIQAKSDLAEAVELHQTIMEDGVMRMTPQEYVDLPVGEQVDFAPGGYHVMLIGLDDDLAVGDTFQLTLVFEEHAEIQLDVTVREP